MPAHDRDPIKEAEQRWEQRWEQNISVMIGQLSDSNPTYRSRAAESLGNSKDLRAVEPLIALLSDPVPDVVWVALRALGTIKDPRAYDPLMQRLDNPDRWIRQGAA